MSLPHRKNHGFAINLSVSGEDDTSCVDRYTLRPGVGGVGIAAQQLAS